MLKNILVVINPISGDCDKAPVVQALQSLVKDETNLTFYKTEGEKDKEKIKQLIEKHEPERILVAGGDGTIKLAAEAIEQNNISIGILPLGSANGLANDLGLPLQQEQFLPIALGNHKRKVDALIINNQLSLHISDLGLNAELIKKFDESNFRGKLGYFINSFSTFYHTEIPYSYTIEANGKKEEFQGIMLAFANSRKFGSGALVNPNGKIDDGKFELLVFKKLDILEMLYTLKKDPDLSEDFVKTIVTTEATITTNRPLDFQIDGEYRKMVNKVEAKIAPGILELATQKSD